MAKRTFLTLVSAGDGAADDITEAGSRVLIERAYAQLRDDIIEGRLAPGEKLRVEHLKAHYQVGAGTLREAITRLVSDALVVAEGHRGFRVAPMTLEDFLDLTQLRLHIELEAMRQSIRHGDDACGRGCSRRSTSSRRSSNRCAPNSGHAGSSSTPAFTRP